MENKSKDELLSKAKELLSNGCSVIPIDIETKSAIVAWKPYQTRPMEYDKFENICRADINIGMSLITGFGGFECIDIDNHLKNAKEVFNDFIELIKNQDKELLNKIYIEKSQNGGYHIIYRCNKPGNNEKLATHPSPSGKPETVVETRGHGGYVVIAPSKGYTAIQVQIENLKIIEDEEREFLISVGKSFHKIEESNTKSKPKKDTLNKIENRAGDDYNKRGDYDVVLRKHGWEVLSSSNSRELWRRPGKDRGVSATFGYVKDKLFVFSTNAAPFEDCKSYDKFAIYAILEHGGDFQQAAKELGRLGYGNTKPLKNPAKLEKISLHDIQADNEVIQQIVDKESGEITEIKLPFCYWYEEQIGNKYVLKIYHTALYKFLAKCGILRIRTNPDTNKIENDILVKIVNNVVLEIDIKEIRTFILNDCIEILPYQISEHFNKEQLNEVLLKGINSYINQDKIAALPVKYVEFLRDSDEAAYFFFKNGFIKVDKYGITLNDYKHLNGYVWNSQIKDFYIEVIKDKSFIEESPKEKSPFYHFTKLLCTFRENTNIFYDKHRHHSFKCAIGYLLHNNVQSAERYAIVITESNLVDEAKGRTGKGLTMRAVEKIRNVAYLSGKNLDMNDKFWLQVVNLDTNVLWIDDTEKTFVYEKLFTTIDSGVQVEKKGKDKFTIPPEKSPKIAITSNYAINDTSESANDRKVEIEVSTYFSTNYKPKHEFGNIFFGSHWNKNPELWNIFYNTMFFFMQEYFEENCEIPSYKSSTIIIRKIKNIIGNDLYKYLTENIELNTEYTFAWVYDQFLLLSDLNEKAYSKKRFSKSLTTYCELMEIKLHEVYRYDVSQKKNKHIKLTKDYEFDERAGIIEFDAKRDRIESEKLAYNDLK